MQDLQSVPNPMTTILRRKSQVARGYLVRFTLFHVYEQHLNSYFKYYINSYFPGDFRFGREDDGSVITLAPDNENKKA